MCLFCAVLSILFYSFINLTFTVLRGLESCVFSLSDLFRLFSVWTLSVTLNVMHYFIYSYKYLCSEQIETILYIKYLIFMSKHHDTTKALGAFESWLIDKMDKLYTLGYFAVCKLCMQCTPKRSTVKEELDFPFSPYLF